MPRDNLILVGFMGAGKTACGRLLARRLGRCFVETDDMIVAREGRSIPEIFSTDGEARFRQLEADALDELKLKSGDVIATGGGFACREGRMAALRELGTVVWLAGDVESLYERARRSGRRPMLEGRPFEAVEALHREREPYYRQAHVIVDTTASVPIRSSAGCSRPCAEPMPHAFDRRLEEGPLLCDGAMGTVLYGRGDGPIDACFNILNLHNPALVQSVHADYIAAGVDCIETNTFDANRVKLSTWGLEALVHEINRRGVRLARDVRESTGRDVLVLGSIGPLGKYLEPVGTVTLDEAREAFREQAEALLEGGVDAFVLETFPGLTELRLAIEVVRSITDLPIIAQMAFTDDGLTYTGRSPADVAASLTELPVQAIGANCSVGSSVLYEVLEQMVPAAGGVALSIQPNAGLPTRVGERLIYLSSPAYMADWTRRMIEAGARIVGGCCGTTPQHIAAMRAVVDQKAPTPRRSTRAAVAVRVRETPETPALEAAPPPTALQKKLEARDFVVTVEIDPPRGHTVDKIVQGAKLLQERGVEIVDINDGSLGRVRMAVLPTALLVRETTGLDVNMHFTCRDRNLMGIQAELLAACALGIRNILAMTGDPPRAGDYANATAVFDVDGVGLIEIIRRMNDGVDATGNGIGGPTFFHVGAALNPAADDLDREIDRFQRKVAAGARWVQTQPIYDLELLDRFLARAGGSPVPVVVGVLPLHSSRHAEFLHNEVPGISIPDRVRARMRDAGDHALRAGIEMAQRLVAEIRPRYAGAYLMPSFGRFEVVAEVLDALR